jgi:hypothetical protein
MDTLGGNLPAIPTAKNVFFHLVRTYCRLEREQAHRKATVSNLLLSWLNIDLQPGLSFQMAQWARSIMVSNYKLYYLSLLLT